MMLMKDYEIKYLKKKLLEEQQKVESMLDESKKNNFGVDDSIGNSIEELSKYDNHPADLGTETFEQEKYVSLRNHRLNTLAIYGMPCKGWRGEATGYVYIAARR